MKKHYLEFSHDFITGRNHIWPMEEHEDGSRHPVADGVDGLPSYVRLGKVEMDASEVSRGFDTNDLESLLWAGRRAGVWGDDREVRLDLVVGPLDAAAHEAALETGGAWVPRIITVRKDGKVFDLTVEEFIY